MTWKLSVNNIAGILNGEATIEEGVNAVRASNWQGKSSLLAAIQTTMGTKTVLREGADEGSVKLVTEDGEYEVSLVRENSRIRREQEPYLEDKQTRICADLFAFLDERNEIRRAVRNGENLKELLTRPLDFENIDEQIATLRRERNQVDTQLQEASDATAKLPDVEQVVTQLEDELDDLRTERAELAGEANGNSDEQEALRTATTERKRTEEEVDRLERTINRTEETLAQQRSNLDNLERPDVDDDLEQRISEVESKLTRTKRDADLLQSIYAPTRRILDENRLELLTDVNPGLMEDTVTCWTCDEETTREQVAEQVEQLGKHVTERQDTVDEYQQKLDRLTTRRNEVESAKRERRTLEQEISDLESTLEERTASLRQARSRLEDLEARVEELAETVQSGDERLTDVESEIKYTERQLEDKREELASLEETAETQSSLERQRENLSEEIASLRTRKENMKRRMRASFESAMQEILNRLGTGFESARLTSNFDIVVAREGREAGLDALSDGEVELLGIFAALAGYEAFDLADDVPVMLVDDLGGLADENIRGLIQYLEDRPQYLVFTAYPEHSSIETNTIDPLEWEVVSPEPA